MLLKYCQTKTNILSRHAFIWVAAILNWTARQEWMKRNKAIPNLSRARESSRSCCDDLGTCLKEIYPKTLWLWQLFLDNAYEKQIILLIKNHFCVDSPAWEVWESGALLASTWGVLTGTPVGLCTLLSSPPFLPGENLPFFTDCPASGVTIQVRGKGAVGSCTDIFRLISISVCYFRHTGDNDFCWFFCVALMVLFIVVIKSLNIRQYLVCISLTKWKSAMNKENKVGKIMR